MKYKLQLKHRFGQPFDVYTLIAWILKCFTVKDCKRNVRKITNKIWVNVRQLNSNFTIHNTGSFTIVFILIAGCGYRSYTYYLFSIFNIYCKHFLKGIFWTYTQQLKNINLEYWIWQAHFIKSWLTR